MHRNTYLKYSLFAVTAFIFSVLMTSTGPAQTPQVDNIPKGAPNVVQLSVLYEHLDGCPSLSALLTFAPEGVRVLSNQATPGHAKGLPVLQFQPDQADRIIQLASGSCRYLIRVEREVLKNGKWVASAPNHP